MIDFPSNPTLDDIFTDASSVRWRCIDDTVGDVQWAREGTTPAFEAAPIGSIVAWANTSLPLGWIECAGQATTGFPALADIVGANVPDLRGEFIRGFDNGKGTDTGRVLGSNQDDTYEDHQHTVFTITADAGTINDARFRSKVNGANQVAEDTVTQGGSVGAGTETRPKNVALIYIIKAFNVVSEGQVSGFVSPNKNYIINPTFSINQRGFAGGATTIEYTFDRWFGTTGANISLPDANGFVTISDVGSDFRQYIESIGIEGLMTVSWDGTATGGISGDGTGVTQTSPFTFDTTGLWIGGASADALTVLFKNGTLKNVKLELGSVATPFEYPDVGTELAKCQRYYEKHDKSMNVPPIRNDGSSLTVRANIMMKQTMRTTPTISNLTVSGGSSSSAIFIAPSGFTINASADSLSSSVHLESWAADAEL